MVELLTNQATTRFFIPICIQDCIVLTLVNQYKGTVYRKRIRDQYTVILQLMKKMHIMSKSSTLPLWGSEISRSYFSDSLPEQQETPILKPWTLPCLWWVYVLDRGQVSAEPNGGVSIFCLVYCSNTGAAYPFQLKLVVM